MFHEMPGWTRAVATSAAFKFFSLVVTVCVWAILMLLVVTYEDYVAAQKKLAQKGVDDLRASLFQYRHDERRCPPLNELLAPHYLQPGMMKDPWGTSMATWCSERSVHVRSAGPDKLFNTPDDVTSSAPADTDDSP